MVLAASAVRDHRTNFSFVDKLEAPSADTLVFTLKSPNAGFKYLLADTTNLLVMPTESDGKFDPTKTMVGSGPTTKGLDI